MKRPIIGVLPLFDENKDSIWMVPGYMDSIEAVGGLPIILPLTVDSDRIEQAFFLCDGLLFTGGHDISPELYNESRSLLCGNPCTERDIMEKKLFELALKYDKPSLGICRGIQLFNALLGGTLYQDIPTQLKSGIVHKQKPPYDVPIHEIEIIKDTPLFDIIGKDRIMVNSYHHQGIRQLASSLTVAAKARDGLIEGVYMKDKRFILAVQWHPEFIYKKDEDCLNIVRSLIEKSKGD